jgi:hypothetical protein
MTMLDKLKAAAVTIAITVVAGSLTALIGFYAGLFYQSSIPISAEATIVTLPNPVISKYSFENSPPKPISDLMKTLPIVLQGAALINNTFQVLQLDIKNNSDV